MECTIVCVCLQRLEQIIVVALKKKGMQRDHMCFRKCYNRLFTLSKSFLKVQYIHVHQADIHVCALCTCIHVLCTICSKQYCLDHLFSIRVTCLSEFLYHMKCMC